MKWLANLFFEFLFKKFVSYSIKFYNYLVLKYKDNLILKKFKESGDKDDLAKNGADVLNGPDSK